MCRQGKRKNQIESSEIGAMFLLAAIALVFGLMLGPAIDKQLDVWDAQDAAHQRMLAHE